MYSKRTIVQNRTGLHARPASDFIRCAKGFCSRITVGRPGGEKVNAKSIVMVLSLAMAQGTEIVIEAVGADEVDAVESLITLVSSLAD